MDDFQLNIPTKVFFGKDALDHLGEICSSKKVLLVYGGSSLKNSGTYSLIVESLKNNNNKIIDFGGHKLPSYQEIEKGIDICKKEEVDVVIGAGGCTCMDMAKIIAFGVKNRGLWSYLLQEKDPTGKQTLPIIEIPTYPSGGSEVDYAAECDDFVNSKHGSLYGIYPTYALINPEFSYSLNKELTAYSGIVGFIQTAAQYFGNPSISKEMVKAVLKSALTNLEIAYNHPQDYEARAALMWVSSLSTIGILGCGLRDPYGYEIYSLEGVFEKIGLQYREALTMYFPRFLTLMSRHYSLDIASFYVDIFNIDPSLEVKEIISLGEKAFIDYCQKYNIKMYVEDFNLEDKLQVQDIIYEKAGSDRYLLFSLISCFRDFEKYK